MRRARAAAGRGTADIIAASALVCSKRGSFIGRPQENTSPSAHAMSGLYFAGAQYMQNFGVFTRPFEEAPILESRPRRKAAVRRLPLEFGANEGPHSARPFIYVDIYLRADDEDRWPVQSASR